MYCNSRFMSSVGSRLRTWWAVPYWVSPATCSRYRGWILAQSHAQSKSSELFVLVIEPSFQLFRLAPSASASSTRFQ